MSHTSYQTAKALAFRTEVRFALGSRNGQRSAIWKLWTQGDEAYLTSRMFGSDMKVSFHSSGQCQWSCTDSWVQRQEIPKNSDRHVKRWSVEQPKENEALLLFRVEIPASELRSQPPLKDRKKVFWVSGIPSDVTVRFLLCLTRVLEADPAPKNTDNLQHLASLRMRNGRWIVVLIENISLSAADLAAAREATRQQLLAEGITPLPEHRAGLLISPSDPRDAHGLLELCLTEPYQ